MITWHKIAEDYPKAFSLWWSWIKQNGELSEYDVECLENQVMFGEFKHLMCCNIGTLYEFFDLQRIAVCIDLDLQGYEKQEQKYGYKVVDYKKTLIKKTWYNYETRVECEKSAFVIAFQLLEKRENLS